LLAHLRVASVVSRSPPEAVLGTNLPLNQNSGDLAKIRRNRTASCGKPTDCFKGKSDVRTQLSVDRVSPFIPANVMGWGRRRQYKPSQAHCIGRLFSFCFFLSRPIVLSASNDSETSSGAPNEVLTGYLALGADKTPDLRKEATQNKARRDLIRAFASVGKIGQTLAS
jgi:hypothetical protein